MPRQLYMPDNRTFLIAPANTNAGVTGLINKFIQGKMMMSSPHQVTASSDYRSLMENGGKVGDKLKYVAAWAGAGDLDRMEFMNFQVWDGSSPLTINVELKFFMGMWGLNNGRDEVYNPMAFLCQLVLPTQVGGALVSPSPNMWAGLTQVVGAYREVADRVARAVSGNLSSSKNTAAASFLNGALGIATSLATGAIDTVAGTLSSITAGLAQWKGIYKIKVGKTSFTNLFLKSATPTFGEGFDENGFPTTGAMRLEFSTLKAARTSDFPTFNVDVAEVNVSGATPGEVMWDDDPTYVGDGGQKFEDEKKDMKKQRTANESKNKDTKVSKTP